MNTINVTRSSLPEFEDYVNEIRDIWDSHWLTNMGEKHKKLQKELLSYMGVEGIELFTNGHMALELTIQALRLEGEIITSPFTFASTTHAIVRNRCTPVFCDIDTSTYTIDADKIEPLITDKTCAIIPIHVYGNICDVDNIDHIAKKHGLKVIYDAAHTFGETYYGQGIGSFGDASCFSFHATKVFNTIEGGAACFKDKELGRELYRLKNFGIKNEEVVDGVGANAKMNEFCAAMGICNLKNVDSEIEKRKKISDRYRKNLENIAGIKLSPIQKGVKSNYAYFPVVFDEKICGCNRDEVKYKLTENSIGTRKYFYPITSAFDCFGKKYDVNATPNALDISMRVLTLPLYPELILSDVDRICDIILSCIKK